MGVSASASESAGDWNSEKKYGEAEGREHLRKIKDEATGGG
jgi:hypothetical protein